MLLIFVFFQHELVGKLMLKESRPGGSDIVNKTTC